jgi:hypothetical protein
MPSKCLESCASRCARLALVPAVLLSLAILSRAQSPMRPSPHNPPAAAKPTSRPGGHHEAVAVHGHWTIEIKNPDGKLVSRTEFENALVQPGGAELMTELLLGQEVTGGYLINLESGSGTGNGPCAALAGATSTECYLVGSLTSPAPATFSVRQCGFSGSPAANQITAAGPCYPLTISLTQTSGGTSLTVSGTAVASTASSITDVYLDPSTCNSTGRTSSIGGANISPNTCAQSPGIIAAPLTHATLSTPVPVTAAGQFIAVTVQLSFQ